LLGANARKVLITDCSELIDIT